MADRSTAGRGWKRVHLPNAARILPTFVSRPPGSDEGDESLFELDARLTERHEESALRGIDNGLERA